MAVTAWNALTRQYEGSSEGHQETKDAKGVHGLAGWGGSSPMLKQHADILVMVPPELVIEKLRGFLDEWKASARKSDDGQISIAIDLRKAPDYSGPAIEIYPVRTSDQNTACRLLAA